MAKFPALPIWTDALIGDTYHLTPSEFGSYLRILIAMWRSKNCRLKDDDAFLGRITGDPRNWKRTRPKLESYFIKQDGFILNRRLLAEYDFVSRKVDKARAAGRASALKRLGVAPTVVTPQEATKGSTPDQPSTPTPTPTPTKKVSKKKTKAIAFDPPDWIPRDAWDGWLEIRKRKHAPLSGTSMTSAVKLLTEARDAGEDVREILERSTVSNWVGIFREKGNGNGNGKESPHEQLARVSAELIADGFGREMGCSGNGGDQRPVPIGLLPPTDD